MKLFDRYDGFKASPLTLHMLRCFNNKPESIVHSTVYCVTYACTSVYLTVCFRKGVSEIPEAKNVDISNLEDTEIDKTVRLPCAIGYVGFVRLKCGSKGWSKDGGRKCERKSMPFVSRPDHSLLCMFLGFVWSGCDLSGHSMMDV